MGQIYELENDSGVNLENVMTDIELRKIELSASNGNGMVKSDKNDSEKEKFIDSDSKIPFDKRNLVYIIFIIHGIGNLMPWNMFITAGGYFDHKLSVNLTDPIENATLSSYRERFMSIESISSQTPNLIFNGLNLFLAYYSSSIGINLYKLITGSIFANILIMAFTCWMTLLDSSTWPLRFFALTIISIVLLNISNGFYQNSIYGAAAKLPMKYTNAVVFGNNLCGTVVASVNIITLLIAPDKQKAAFLYFLSAVIILFLCYLTFRKLMKNDFYRFHTTKDESVAESARPSYMYILKHCGIQCFNVFLTFFVTLLLFPAVLAAIKRTDKNFFLDDTFFSPVCCFLNFNLFAMIGNITPNYFKTPSPQHLWIPVLLRTLFIPFFLFCNFKPTTYPLLIPSEWMFILGTSLMGLTHGHLCSLGMMYAPKTVAKEHSPIAGMLSAFCLICGISAGVTASILL